ncbi:hypothetical protein P12x_005153 [Tundrisphaera lichenicola]|uniref:hypothetical protein n=1 Tax=Tundrisphaera lichenicola TaxID=2029860 RepID=UPI003EB9A1B7
MISKCRWIGSAAICLLLASGSAEAQFYGGGFWGEGFGGVGTPQGDMARGAGMYAMGMGQYNLDTAKANSIDADTMMRWNQYIYNSRLEGARLNRERMARQEQNRRENSEAIRLRLRNSPNQVDISSGNALNVTLDELSNPRIFQKAVYQGSKLKLGGELIRNIPFSYAAAAISISFHQLTQGRPPACLRRDEFTPDIEKLKEIVAELRREGEESGTTKPETILKAKDQIVVIRTKVEATFPRSSQDFRDASRYLKALYGLATMLETPAVDLLLAGVENRPEATLGDLLAFMAAYNLRFGASQNPQQRQAFLTLQPMLTKIRDELIPDPASALPSPVTGLEDAPGAVFDDLGYNHAESKSPAKPQ